MPYSWLSFTVGCQGELLGGGGGGPSMLKVFPVDSERILLVGEVSIFFFHF